MWPILNKNVFLISCLVNVLHHLVVKKKKKKKLVLNKSAAHL